jgi:hypothetical protein
MLMTLIHSWVCSFMTSTLPIRPYHSTKFLTWISWIFGQFTKTFHIIYIVPLYHLHGKYFLPLHLYLEIYLGKIEVHNIWHLKNSIIF